MCRTSNKAQDSFLPPSFLELCKPIISVCWLHKDSVFEMLCLCAVKLRYWLLITEVNSTAHIRAAWNHDFMFSKNVLSDVSMENVRRQLIKKCKRTNTVIFRWFVTFISEPPRRASKCRGNKNVLNFRLQQRFLTWGLQSPGEWLGYLKPSESLHARWFLSIWSFLTQEK